MTSRAVKPPASAEGDPRLAASPPVPAAAANRRPEPGARTPVVALEGVTLSYAGRRGVERLEVAKDIGFSIGAGELVSLVGPSGCGKSTLLTAIAGLLPAERGSISVAGELAIVFQRPSLAPWRTVTSNVGLGLEVRGVPKAERLRRSQATLAAVGLEGYGSRYPHELSGGMQQRVNLARALVMNPDVLLFDEPFAALDAQTREDMQDELLRIWSASEKAGLFVTHQIDEAVFLADRVLVMSKGPASTVVDEVPVDLPRPRELDLKRSASFQELVGRISDHIRRRPAHPPSVDQRSAGKETE